MHELNRHGAFTNGGGYTLRRSCAHVAGREAQSEAQIATFDRWVVPVVSRLEQWAPAPFGQSLLAVMERK